MCRYRRRAFCSRCYRPRLLGARFSRDYRCNRCGIRPIEPGIVSQYKCRYAGKPQIALGDALGSNVVNVALILALALVISGIRSPRDSIKRDFPVALLVPIITGVLCLDGVLSRIDGLLRLSMFLACLVAAVIEARKQRSAANEVLGEQRGWLAALFCIAGLVLLFAAGILIVKGAKGTAISFGIDEFIIGATFVAIGTSVPGRTRTAAKWNG